MSQQFGRNVTIYCWCVVAGDFAIVGVWYVCMCARASTVSNIWKYTSHMCTNYIRILSNTVDNPWMRLGSLESTKITIRTNNKNWCYMILARLLFSHYCLLLFNLKGGVWTKPNDDERKLAQRKCITYAEIFRKGLSHKTYNILRITSKAA